MQRLSHLAEQASHAVTEWCGSTAATLLSLFTVVAWTVGGLVYFGFGDTYQLVINTVTTLVTFVMVFLIQRTQNKDSLVLHTKLNELVRAIDKADNALIRLEQMPEDEVKRRHDSPVVPPPASM
jgi:low affinity Fe/Cu permease